MSLAEVLALIDYDTDIFTDQAAADEFIQSCDVLITTAYLGSPVAAAMFEKLVSANQTLTIAYSPGSMNSEVGRYKINFDFAAANDAVLIDKDGTLFTGGPRRFLIHEAVHAIEGTRDFPLNSSPSTPGFDFQGPTVAKTNIIEDQLGSDNTRVSYWGDFSNSHPEDFANYVDGFTQGHTIDIAYTATDGKDYAFVDTSTQSEATRDLLIGLGSDNTFISGYGNDWLYGGHGNNFLDGGNDDDHLFGEGGMDTIFGGEGDDTLEGGAGADELLGGAGDDTLIIDIDDMYVSGGDDFDTVFLTGTDNYNIDMSFMEVEAVIGGGGNDTITALVVDDLDASTSSFGSDGHLILAGGQGDDRLVVTRDIVFGGVFPIGPPPQPEHLPVYFGGEGADTFVVGLLH